MAPFSVITGPCGGLEDESPVAATCSFGILVSGIHVLMLPLFHLQVATLENRHEILQKIHDSVCDSGAWVTNFQKLSHASVCLELEVSVKNLAPMHSALRSLGLNVDPGHDVVLDLIPTGIREDPEKAIAGVLMIKFLSREIDLPGPLSVHPKV